MENETVTPKVVGQIKWFNKNNGYGFANIVLIHSGLETFGLKVGDEVFVHHTSIKPATKCYHMLYAGEYVEFDIIRNKAGDRPQTKDVTGIRGGKLMCDINEESKSKRKDNSKRVKKTENDKNKEEIQDTE